MALPPHEGSPRVGSGRMEAPRAEAARRASGGSPRPPAGAGDPAAEARNTTRSRSSGVPEASSRGASAPGSAFPRMISADFPANGLRPVRDSYSITPKLYQSLASETGRPAPCSGDM